MSKDQSQAAYLHAIFTEELRTTVFSDFAKLLKGRDELNECRPQVAPRRVPNVAKVIYEFYENSSNS